MDAEQREILTKLAHHCVSSDHATMIDFLRTVYYRINDLTIANCALTMLYHDIAPRPLPDDACDDDGEHREIMLNEADHLLTREN